MLVRVNVEELVSHANAYLSYKKNFFMTRVEYGYRKNKLYRVGTVKDIDDAYEWFERCEHALIEICNVTGISFDALVQMARIAERYYNTRTYQNLGKEFDHEDLYAVLTAKEPEWKGPYRNEYTVPAIHRMNEKRYEENRDIWGTW